MGEAGRRSMFEDLPNDLDRRERIFECRFGRLARDTRGPTRPSFGRGNQAASLVRSRAHQLGFSLNGINVVSFWAKHVFRKALRRP